MGELLMDKRAAKDAKELANRLSELVRVKKNWKKKG